VAIPRPRSSNRLLVDKLYRERLQNWLREEDAPLAIVSMGPNEAASIADAISNRGWKLGVEVALIHLTHPAESHSFGQPEISFSPNDWRQVGYAAAGTLVQWVREDRQPPAVQWVPPSPLHLTETSDSSFSANLVTRVQSLLKHSKDYDLSVSSVASMMGVGLTKLYEEFRASGQGSLRNALVDRRLAEAARMLRATDLPVEDIAIHCGYRAGNSLSIAFIKKYGVSPKKWRSLH